jgi:hypothetical protein
MPGDHKLPIVIVESINTRLETRLVFELDMMSLSSNLAIS